VPPLGRRLRLGVVGGGRGSVVGTWHRNGARLSGQWDVVAGALSTDPERARLSAADWCIAPGAPMRTSAKWPQPSAAAPTASRR